MKKTNSTIRPETLAEGPLHYAPENELGVVFLFSHLAKRWRLRIDKIRSGFPDCIAFQKSHGKEKKIAIEFEFKSRNFQTHGHAAKQCDWIVCWEHNWPEVPARLNVVELRREFGMGFNVWIMPVKKEFQDDLDNYPRGEWSVPGQAHKNDLLLFYFSGGDNKCIRSIYKCEERAYHVKNAAWKKGSKQWKKKGDHRAVIRRICKIKAPVFLEDLRRHRVLRTAGFVRGDMRTRLNATEYWPYLHELIARRNPLTKVLLKKFSPDTI